MKQRLSTVFYLQTDDQTERQNQILEYYLHCYCCKEQDDWMFFLLMTEFVYANRKHATISQTSFETLMSYYLRIAQHVENNIYEEKMSAAKDWAQ